MTKITLFTLSLVVGNLMVFAQSHVTSRMLTEKEVDSIFCEDVSNALGVKFPIYRVYEFNDKGGKHYVVLTENGYQTGKQSTNDTIQAFNIIVNNEELKVGWTFLDFIQLEGDKTTEEHSIWFWTKYMSIVDLDKDGLVDPIVIYGTSSINGTDDGRIRILTYYKGSKRAIRHQNGILDFDRRTQVDSTFYDLPLVIQAHVKAIMSQMAENGLAVFTNDWWTQMKNKELEF